jgi:hypothetical protein
MAAEHHDERLAGGVIEVGGAACLGQPHGDPVRLEQEDDVQGQPAGDGRIERTRIFYDQDPATSSSAAGGVRPVVTVCVQAALSMPDSEPARGISGASGSAAGCAERRWLIIWPLAYCVRGGRLGRR